MEISPKQLDFIDLVVRSLVNGLLRSGSIEFHEQQEICDELRLQILSEWHRFNPARAVAEAFINQVGKTRLISILRARGSQKRARPTRPLDASDHAIADPSRGTKAYSNTQDLRVDYARVMAKFTPEQRVFCQRLERDGLKVLTARPGPAATRNLAMLESIRIICKKDGLDIYLDP